MQICLYLIQKIGSKVLNICHLHQDVINNSEREKKSDFHCQFVFRGYQLLVLIWGIIAIVVLTEIKHSISNARSRQSSLHQLYHS